MNFYHYNHLTNLTPQELFMWIAVDKTLEQVGGQDVAAAIAILAGQPIIPTRAKFGGATKGTSVVSITARRLLNYDVRVRLPTLTKESIKSLKFRFTTNLGAYIGRAVPGVGWAILGYDVIQIIHQIIQTTASTYNLLVKSEDRLF